MGGQHIHYRMAQMAAAEADAAVLALGVWRAQQALALAARRPCGCPHPASEHDRDEGCLYGWGEPPAVGCMCDGTPA
jgi:hypothetical protein